MHKKPLIAVLILGLLLLTGNAFAIQGDDDYFVRVQSPPLEKGALNLVDKGVEPLTAIQGGTPRVVPGTFCTVDATGGWSGYYYGDMVWAGETYVSYNDVDVHSPGCAGLPNNYTFDVTATNYIACNDYPGASYWLQPVVYDADLSNPACPFPGPLSCAGPVYLFVLPLDNCYGLNMAFAIECCVPGPYFAGFYCPAQDFNIGMAIDYTMAVPLLQCQTYNNYGGPPWGDVFDWGVVANFLISSEGFTPDDVATHCTPGTCEYQWYYPGTPPGSVDDMWDAGYGLRSGQYGGRDKLGVRFEAIGLDTLKDVGFLLYGPFTTDPAPDILVEVWDDGGGASYCGYPTPSGAPLWSTVVPGASLLYYPTPTVVTIPDLTFGTLNGGPIDYFFITITTTDASHLAGLSTGFAAYAGPYPDLGCQTGGMWSLAYYSVYDVPSDDPTGDLGPTWVYIGGRDLGNNGHAEFVMEATICAEQIPIVEEECGPGSTDQWPTFGHDYQNTSASSINVGDPNGIKLEWSVNLGSDMSFCNPTVADDIVYASSSDRFEAFDLATGAPIPGSPFTGIPEMGTSNRANNTVHGGFVYITGGNFAAITKQPAGDLNKSATIWSNNAMTMADMQEQNRFGCAMVIDDLGGSGTDVVFVLTEPIQNPGLQGELFAFDASDGTLYSGWGTNPVLLDKAARHGPSYDGTWLFVGTGDATLDAGSIWCIDPVTGAPVWQFMDNVVDPAAPGGFPGGVSIDGDLLFAVSADANTAGRRFCIDKSAGTANVVWATGQGSRSLYGPPTIGRNFIYVPFDNNGGIGMIDKSIGLQVHNFMLQGVGQITQHVTIACDNILFAGTRDAKWWCLNANSTDYEFYRQYPVPDIGIVNGTALASHSGGDDYAVVGIRYDGVNGLISAYKLGTGARPRLEQYVWDVELLVPLGATGTDHAAIADVFENIGDAALTIGPANPAASSVVASVSRTMPTDERGIAKYRSARMVGNGEWHPSVYSQLSESTAKGSNRSNVYTAAGAAALVRTSNVTLNGGASAVLAAGDLSDLQFDYDVSGLGRGVDIEVIELPNDDPDFDLTPVTSMAYFEVTYQGGCPTMWDTLTWVDGHKGMTNVGEMGVQGGVDNLVWDLDPIDPEYGIMYDGGFYLLWGDSTAEAVRNYMFGEGGDFVGNVSPVGGACGFDHYAGLTLGYWNNAGTPVAITGTKIVVSYSDTNMASGLGTNPEDAIGVDIVETQIGADDALYGGYALIQLEYTERNGNALPEIYGGTFIDWDIPANYGSNLSAIWPTTVGGYACWDELGAGNAYGFFDPSNEPIQGAISIDHNNRGVTPGTDGLFWNMAVSEAAAMLNDGQGDRGCMLTSGAVAVPAYGTAAIHQALFAVDATGGSASVAQMEADAMALRTAAARWAGFDRGNVNDDGGTNLCDVWYLNMHVNVDARQLYPDTYCGDVDASGVVDQADVDYLFAYVTALGPAPQGAWRF